MQSKSPRQAQHYYTTRFYVILVTYQRSAIVKSFSASRNNLEKLPSSRGDHCHTGMLPNRDCTKAVHLGCHIKWLSLIQITHGGKGVHETSHTHNLICSLINGKVIHYSYVSHMICVPSLYVLILTVSLCSFCGWTGGVHGPATAKAFTSSEACIKPLPFLPRGSTAPITVLQLSFPWHGHTHLFKRITRRIFTAPHNFNVL